ncbi:MAG: hypothetical protein Q7S04_02660 [Candidatus Moranbacteria bacterium]|nr:hypothetical protein [Candidatus Moranbacteria bacterium]
MKTKLRFTLMAAAMVAALAAPAIALQPPAQIPTQGLTAASLLDAKATVLPDIAELGSLNAEMNLTAAAKEMAPGFTTIGTRIDAAALGSLAAKYTFNGANTLEQANLGANMDGAGYINGKEMVDVNAMKSVNIGAPGLSRTAISHQAPLVEKNGVTNATAIMVSYPARYAHGLELAGNTFMSIGNSSQSGGAPNK